MSGMTSLALLAGVMAGEAAVIGDDAMMAVGHVVMNRVQHPWFSYDIGIVIVTGFNGFQGPTLRHIRLARRVLREPDTTGGALFALSRQDRIKLGFPEGDTVHKRNGWELHLYRRWPGG